MRGLMPSCDGAACSRCASRLSRPISTRTPSDSFGHCGNECLDQFVVMGRRHLRICSKCTAATTTIKGHILLWSRSRRAEWGRSGRWAGGGQRYEKDQGRSGRRCRGEKTRFVERRRRAAGASTRRWDGDGRGPQWEKWGRSTQHRRRMRRQSRRGHPVLSEGGIRECTHNACSGEQRHLIATSD